MFKKCIVFTFSHVKAYVSKIGLPVKQVKVIPGSSFASGEEDFLVVFTIYWAWRPSWSCDQDPANKLLFPLPMDAPHKISV